MPARGEASVREKRAPLGQRRSVWTESVSLGEGISELSLRSHISVDSCQKNVEHTAEDVKEDCFSGSDIQNYKAERTTELSKLKG